MSEFINKSTVFDEVKFKDLFQSKIVALFVEFLLYFKSDIIPVTRSDRFVS
jgi:hypothetical protein